MLYKVLCRVSVVALTIFVIVSSVLIVINNRRFPNANEKESKSVSVDWCGCEITAVDKHIYTVDEYIEAFPNDQNYTYIKNKGKDYSDNVIVVVKIKVKNTTTNTVSFLVSNANMELFPSMASNGVPIISGKTKIAPGEEVEQTGAALFTSAQLRHYSVDEINNNIVQLVFSYYPDKIAVRFE